MVKNKKHIARKLNKKLTALTPLVDSNLELFTVPKGVDFWNVNFKGDQTERMVIYLRSDVGCSYGVKTGGCAGCKHWKLGTAGRKLNIDNMYIKQYKHALNKYGIRKVMCLYNEGNMFNNDELPIDQLLYMVDDLNKKGVKRLILESRPEFIQTKTLNKIKSKARDMEIEVGIGLESKNNVIRNELFLKGMCLSAFESAVTKLASFGMRSLAYVLLKPAFLTEAQAIKESIDTIKYAFSVDVDAVSLETIGVEPYTITDLLHKDGEFVPAKLWSVLDCVRQTYNLGEIRIGGFQFKPRPITMPSNCEHCTDIIIEAIENWNLTYNPNFLSLIECNCMNSYRDELIFCNDHICDDTLLNKLSEFVLKHENCIANKLV